MGFKPKLDTKQSLVVELLNGIENTISQVTRWNINQPTGQPYGTIRGDYIYADNGKPIINQTGSASRIGVQRTGEK
jgi:hypothetical protein